MKAKIIINSMLYIIDKREKDRIDKLFENKGKCYAISERLGDEAERIYYKALSDIAIRPVEMIIDGIYSYS